MSAEMALFLKENISEIRSELKELLQKQHEQDKRLHGVEIKSGFMGLLAGFIAGFFK